MNAWPLAGNLSLFELFRELAPGSVLCGLALSLLAGMLLAVLAIWLWCRRGNEGREHFPSAFGAQLEAPAEPASAFIESS